MNLKEVRKERSIQAKDMVEVVHSIYPKYDKTLHSKVERPEEYGIELRKDAIDAICSTFSIKVDEPAKKRKADIRKLPKRVQCRLGVEEYDLLQTYIRQDGYETMQDWLLQYILKYLNRKGQIK